MLGKWQTTEDTATRTYLIGYGRFDVLFALSHCQPLSTAMDAQRPLVALCQYLRPLVKSVDSHARMAISQASVIPIIDTTRSMKTSRKWYLSLARCFM